MTIKSYHHSTLQLVVTLWLLGCSAAFLAYSLANPIAEWDMLAYAASADAMDGTSPEVIHSRVYTELEERATMEEFEAITASNEYRRVMYADAQAFNEQLPYYRIRITFNGLIKALNNLGISLYDAGYYITAVAFVLTLVVLWGSLNDRIHPAFQFLFPIMFYKYTKDLEVVQQVLADSLSSLWVVFICIAYLRGTRLLLPLIALSVYVRVDLAIFSGLVLLLLFATSERKNYFSLIVCGVVLVASFLFVQKVAGSYGWKTLYYFAIISDMLATHPSQYSAIGFSFSEYLHSLVYPPRWISRMYWVTAVFVVALLLAWNFTKLDEYNKKVCRISTVCLLYIGAHYLIFPQMYLRFFVAQNMMIFAGFSILATYYWQVFLDNRRKDVRHSEERTPSI